MTEKFVGRVHLLVTIMILKVIFTTYDIIGVLYIYYILYIYMLCRYLKRPYRTYGRAG